jgi:hypothetical protein
MADTSRPLRVMVAGEASALNEGALELLLGEIGERPGCVVIVGVARPPAIITKWASLSGLATPGSMTAQALEEASVAARAFASLLPERVSVQYMAAGSWADALRLASDDDLLIVIGRPQRRSDRRALGRAARVVPGARNGASGVMRVTPATGGAA